MCPEGRPNGLVCVSAVVSQERRELCFSRRGLIPQAAGALACNGNRGPQAIPQDKSRNEDAGPRRDCKMVHVPHSMTVWSYRRPTAEDIFSSIGWRLNRWDDRSVRFVRACAAGWMAAQHAREMDPEFPISISGADKRSKGFPTASCDRSHSLRLCFSRLSQLLNVGKPRL